MAQEPTVNELGETIGIIGTSHDIASLKQREKKLQKENEDLKKKVMKLTTQLTNAKDALKREKDEHSVVHLKKERNKIEKWAPLVRDNTNRIWTESALKESEQHYRMLGETMREGMGIQDKNGKIIYINDQGLNMAGYTREELIGKPPTILLDKANLKILEGERKKRKKGKRSSYEITWTRKDGQKVHTIISPRGLFSADGTYNGTFAVITDITELKLALQALQEKEKELQLKRRHLEETNTALKVLLKRKAKDKSRLEEAVLINVKELVEPYLEKLKNSCLNQSQTNLLAILSTNLNDLTSPFTRKLSVKLLKLTPMEIQVANFVKQGKTNKEIADQMCLSPKTIEFHRENLRKKIGIKNKRINLRTRLLSYE
ncbi:MAG: PAS and helix-turn-helix domain-containing protein [Pseudomonadota bacterium]